jgi:hypothetical protein
LFAVAMVAADVKLSGSSGGAKKISDFIVEKNTG